jgi:hypothetical protein
VNAQMLMGTWWNDCGIGRRLVGSLAVGSR